MNLRFSGHETFVVRTFWPKKGYDFVSSGGNFNNENAVVGLGVGKNMVSSIQHWMRALSLLNEKNELSELSHFLFGEAGVDPFLEDIGSIWLLHYHLIKTNYASIYSAIFNKFRKERSSFTKIQLNNFVKRLYRENDDARYNPQSVDKDISVFIRLYNTPDYKIIKNDFEEEVSGLMLELELLSSTFEDVHFERGKRKEEWFHLNAGNRPELPSLITLFTILDQNSDSSAISFRRLEVEDNNPGLVFLLSKDGLYYQLKQIESIMDGVIVSETAGVINLILPQNLNKWEILRKYYGN